MRTVTVILIAALVLVCGPPVAEGKNESRAPEPQPRGSPPSAAEGWPRQWAGRTLQRGAQALVYAQKKAAADEAARMLRTVVEDVRQDGLTKPAAGLIVVIDAQEKFPFEIARLEEILKDPNAPTAGEKSKEILNSIKEARKLSDQAGTDMNSLVAVFPIPLRPDVLPKVAGELPEGIDREIGWCLLIPTDGYVRASMRAVFEAMVKIDKMNWKERLLIGAFTPLAQYEAEKELRKTRQADLYQLLVEGQTDLSRELKKEKVNAYRQRLGIGGPSKPADPESTKGKRNEEPRSP